MVWRRKIVTAGLSCALVAGSIALPSYAVLADEALDGATAGTPVPTEGGAGAGEEGAEEDNSVEDVPDVGAAGDPAGEVDGEIPSGDLSSGSAAADSAGEASPEQGAADGAADQGNTEPEPQEPQSAGDSTSAAANGNGSNGLADTADESVEWGASLSLSAQTVSTGGSVTVTPKVSGVSDASGFTYNYGWCYNGEWDEWDSTVKAGGGRTSQASWEFTPKRAGRYLVFVDVCDPWGKVETHSAWVTVKALSWDAELDVDRSIAWGEAPVISVSIDGADAAGFTYNYVWAYGSGSNDWDEWGSTKRSTGAVTESPMGTFTPSRSGTYRIYVDVTDPWGTTRTVSTTVKVGTPQWSASVAAPSTVELGEAFTVSPRVTGAADTSGYTYNYVWNYRDAWDEWGSTALSSGNETSATSQQLSFTKSGRYRIYIDVVDAWGAKQTVSTWVTVNDEDLSFNSVSLTGTEGARLGGTVHIAPNFSATTDTYLQYRYTWTRAGDGASGVIADWSHSPEVDWTVCASGDVTVTVEIKDSGGNVVSRSTSFHVDPESWNYAGVEGTTHVVKVGQSMTLTPQVSGTTDYLTYRYTWRKNGTSEQGIIQEASHAATSCSWTPSSTGEYTVACEVTGSDGTTVTNEWNLAVWNLNGVTATWNGNNKWTIVADLGISDPAAYGFTYNYVWNYEGGWSSWSSTLRDTGGYDSNPVWSFSPWLSGRFDLYVDVRDANGATATGGTSVVRYNGSEYDMWQRIRTVTSPTQYLLACDTSSCVVGVYRNVNGQWDQIARWSCTTGAASTPTVTGVFSVGEKGYYFDSYGSRCFYYTQFYGDYLFHSTLYYPGGGVMDSRLGMHLSHGCVRLNINDAKWIYDNIPRGTTVVVY